MSSTKFKAGIFTLEGEIITGSPQCVAHLSRAGMSEVMAIKHTDMKDIAYVLERMAATMRAALPGDKKHEMN